MKKIFVLFTVFLFALGIVGSVGAVTISYEFSLSTDGTLTTPYDWATVETFDAEPLLWSWTGSGAIVQGSVSGKYAAPYNSDLMTAANTTKYVTVPDPAGTTNTGSYTASLGGSYNYFGIFWGSVDTYNTLSFYKDDSFLLSFTGTDITTPNAANGNQSAPYTNLYVNFFDLPDFNKFTMSSTNFAFEADNIAVGVKPVPEPATMLLLGAGLLGLGGLGRKKLLRM